MSHQCSGYSQVWNLHEFSTVSQSVVLYHIILFICLNRRPKENLFSPLPPLNHRQNLDIPTPFQIIPAHPYIRIHTYLHIRTTSIPILPIPRALLAIQHSLPGQYHALISHRVRKKREEICRTYCLEYRLQVHRPANLVRLATFWLLFKKSTLFHFLFGLLQTIHIRNAWTVLGHTPGVEVL